MLPILAAIAVVVSLGFAEDPPATDPAATPPAAAAPEATDPATPPAPDPPAPEAPAAIDATGGRGRIRGVVTDTDKRPLGGRLVVLASSTEGESLRVTSTDEKGRYQFRDLAAGKYEVRLEADGFAPETKKDIDVRPPFQNVVDVTLRRASTPPPARPGAAPAPPAAPVATAPMAGGSEVVQGVLRDNDGKPVVEAEVMLVPLAAGVLRQGSSDPQGTFRVDGVAPGAYRLIVRSLGHVPIDVSRVEVAPGRGLSIRLTLVDYALNFVSGKDLRQVQERPRPRAARAGAPATPVPPSTKALAPEPEPDPLVPPPPEEQSTTPPPAGSDQGVRGD